MKKPHFFHLLLASSLILAGISPVAAQKADNPVYYHMKLWGTLSGEESEMIVLLTDEEGNEVEIETFNEDDDFSVTTTETASLYPNKNYTVSVTGYAGTAIVYLVPISEVALMVDDIVQSSITIDNYPTTFTVRLGVATDLPLEGAPTNLRAGDSSSIVSDKPIWYLGLGKMRNGETAGAIGFRQPDFSDSDFFEPDILYYDAPDTSDIEVIAPSGPIEQVLSREVLVDINDGTSANTYTLEVYPRSQKGTKSGGYWVPTGSPFVTFTVSKPTVSGGTGVKVSRAEDSNTWETSLELVGTTWTHRDWRKTTANAENKVTTYFSTTTSATVTHRGRNAADTAYENALVWTKTFSEPSWGKELDKRTFGAGGTTPLIHDYDYHTSTGSGGIEGELKWLIKPDGSWVRYEYYDTNTSSGAKGMVKRVYRPWEDGPSSPSTATISNSLHESWIYTDAIDGSNRLPEIHRVWEPGETTVLSKTIWDYDFDTGSKNDHTIAEWIRWDYSDASNYIETITRYHREDDDDPYFREKPLSVVHPDGRMDSYAYFDGTWSESARSFTGSSSGDDRLVLIFHGQDSTSSGVTSWAKNGETWYMDEVYMIANRSTVTEQIIDTHGRLVLSAENVYTSSGTIERISGTLYRYDSHGRLTTKVDLARSTGTTSSDELKVTRTYLANLLATETSTDGVQTKYEYDDLLRLEKKTLGYGGSTNFPAKVQEFAHDGAGRVAEVYDSSTSATEYSYDSAGRIDQITEPSPNGGTGLITFYSYPTKQKRVTELPTGVEKTEETYLDGRPKSVTADTGVPVYYDYDYNSTGLKVTRTNGTASDAPWVEEQFDRLSRLESRTRPTWGWSTSATSKKIKEEFSYDSRGLLIKQRTKDLNTSSYIAADKLYEYDGFGRLSKEGLDVNASGGLQDTSNDRITAYDTWYIKDSWGWLKDSIVKTAPETTGGLTVTTLYHRSRMTGFNNGVQPSTGQWVVGDVVEWDASGAWSLKWDYATPSDRERYSSSLKQGVSNAEYAIWTNGYLDYTISSSGVDKLYYYDANGRLDKVYSRWNGTYFGDVTDYDYHGDTEYVDSVTDGGLTTSYSYAWDSSAGTRKVTETRPGSKTVHTLYDGMDRPIKTWGSAAQPVSYTYDSYGRIDLQTTYRTGSFTGTDWPGSPGTGATTNWNHENPTGLLEEKVFADANKTTYTYTPIGLTKTRQTARGMIETYKYYDENAGTSTSHVSHLTHDLWQIDYSDASTTDVTYTNRRSGQPYQITDVTGTRTFAYRTDMQLSSEALSSGFYGSNRTVTPTYDTSAPGRRKGVDFKSGSTVQSATALTFDATKGRISKVGGKSGTPTLTYDYLSETDWVETVYDGSTIGSSDYVRTNTLVADRMILDKVETKWRGSSRGTYDSTFDTRGLRATQVQSGTIPYNSTTTFSYNDRAEVTGSTNSTHYWKSWTWGYDMMGKRTSAYNYLTGTITYTPGSASTDVNKYASITSQTGLSYDADGNLTQDGTWYYRYDGANRLKEMERKNGTQTLQFIYDYLDRRVRKTERSTGPTSSVVSSTKYVWSGWKMIAELNAGTGQTGSTWLRGYVWGIDFSNAAGAAGGAGSLIAVNTSSATYLPVYDSMGNITGYVDSATGTVAAGCEYNAFGQILTTTGSWTNLPFGYATQFTDRESGFVYYGLRYYDTWQGRFINRDPIEEAGGLNLYSFTGNGSTNKWDVLGAHCRNYSFFLDDELDDYDYLNSGWWYESWIDSWLWRPINLCSARTRGRLEDPGNPAPGPVLHAVQNMTRAAAFDGESLVPADKAAQRGQGFIHIVIPGDMISILGGREEYEEHLRKTYPDETIRGAHKVGEDGVYYDYEYIVGSEEAIRENQQMVAAIALSSVEFVVVAGGTLSVSGASALGRGTGVPARVIGSRSGSATQVVRISPHGMRHFPASTQSSISAAINQDLAALGNVAPGQMVQRTITVGGKRITYRGFGLPDGSVNVGTAFPGTGTRNIAIPRGGG